MGAIGSEATVGFFVATTSPLFHTYFFPALIHVYFFPFATAVDPAFLQESPTFTAALALTGTRRRAPVINEAISLFTI